MRVVLSNKSRRLLFNDLEKQNIDLNKMSEITGRHTRTLSDWKRGKYSIPKDSFDRLIFYSSLKTSDLKTNFLDDWWNNKEAAKKGGKISMNKHGNPATPESLRKGGVNSYLLRRDRSNDIFAVKSIYKPAKSSNLAEFAGILIGDGSLSVYQVAIYTNATDDYLYSQAIANLIRKLFKVDPGIRKIKNQNCIAIVISSIELVRFLKSQGILQGDKIRQGLDIPEWIAKNQHYSKACLRGVFDTDGCIFQARHDINGKLYSYPRMSFTSASKPLRSSIYKLLVDLKFDPRIRNNKHVNLERRQDIHRYFKLIGSSNPKHLQHFENFGGVA